MCSCSFRCFLVEEIAWDRLDVTAASSGQGGTRLGGPLLADIEGDSSPSGGQSEASGTCIGAAAAPARHVAVLIDNSSE